MTAYLTIVAIKTIIFVATIVQQVLKKGTIKMAHTDSHVENPSGRVYITIHSHHPPTEKDLHIIQTLNFEAASEFAKIKGWSITVNNRGEK